MIETVRRIVMGGGRDTGTMHTQVEAIEPAVLEKEKAWFVWGWDEMPILPRERAEPYEPRSWFPAAGGVRVTALQLGVEEPSAKSGDAGEMIEQLLAAEPAGYTDDPKHPRMHRSDTVDIGVVVSGKLVIEDEDGEETVLGPGDVYVQYGGMHCWPHPDAPAHIVFVALGVERRGP